MLAFYEPKSSFAQGNYTAPKLSVHSITLGFTRRRCPALNASVETCTTCFAIQFSAFLPCSNSRRLPRTLFPFFGLSRRLRDLYIMENWVAGMVQCSVESCQSLSPHLWWLS